MSEPLETWAILELMGHRRLAGFLTEAEVAGAKMLRIDVPGRDGQMTTQFYPPAAVYAITPTTEELARRFAEHAQPRPVSVYELPAPAEPDDDEDRW